jgi:SAM-dependent methyltransferase
LAIIPFYGARDRELYAIERAAMDRRGRVPARLDALLPTGLVLDVGAGDGFTASRLAAGGRTVVPMEPAAGMIDRGRHLPWVRGDAERLPFGDGAFAAAYSTWAYFFPRDLDIARGLAEMERAVRAGGAIVVVDNAGGDEFCAMAEGAIHADLEFWRMVGFEIEVIETAFAFDSIEDATRLLTFFFGERARPALEVEFNAAVMVKIAR